MNLNDAVNRQTQQKLFVSLASKPGTTGSTFYNKLFEHHDIDAEYIACTCTHLDEDIELARDTCSGLSITMPFKLAVADYIDEWICDPGPVNTIKVENHNLIAYNCDLLGLEETIGDLIANKSIIVLGDGAMSNNVINLCEKYNATYHQYSRKLGNWQDRHRAADVLINCTSVGMSVKDCPIDQLNNISTVVDCVIGSTKLINMAKQAGLSTVAGAEIYMAQFAHQFEIYTGIQPDHRAIKDIAKRVFPYV